MRTSRLTSYFYYPDKISLLVKYKIIKIDCETQLQGQPSAQVVDSNADSRIQALAASMLPFFWPSFQLASHPQSANIQVARQPNSRIASANSATVTNWPLLTNSATTTTELSSSQPQTTAEQLSASPADAWPLQYLSTSTSRTQKLSSPMAASNFVPTIVSFDADSESNNNSGLNELESNNSQQESTVTSPSITTTPTVTPKPVSSLKQQATTTVARKKNRKPNYLTQSSSAPYLDSTRLASRYPMPKIKFQLRETTPLPSTTNSNLFVVDNHKQLAVQDKQQQHHKMANLEKQSQSQLSEGKLQHIQVPKSLSKLIENQLLTNATYLLAHHKNITKHNNGKLLMAPPTTSISKVVRLKNDTDLQIMLQTASRIELDLKRRDPQMVATEVADLKNAKISTTKVTKTAATTLEETQVATTTTLSPLSSLKSSPKPTLPLMKMVVQTATVAPSATSTTPTSVTTIDSATTTTATTKQPPRPTTTTAASTTPHVAQELDQLRGGQQHATGKRQVKSNMAVATTKPSFTAVLGEQDNTNKEQPIVKPQLDEMIGSNKVLPEEEDQQQQQQQQTTSSISFTGSKSNGSTPSKYGIQDGEFQATSKRRHRKEGTDLQQHHNQHRHPATRVAERSSASNKNIKLFHFKRKPDMAKLPFYKKPLNYTELGWTPEQIQEHLEQSAALLGSIQGGDISGGSSNNANNNNQPLLSGEKDATNGSTTNPGNVSEEARVELLLLKRKRRGKSQFERLMAELHGSNNIGGGQSVTPSTGGSLVAPFTDSTEQQENSFTSETPTETEGSAYRGALGIPQSQLSPSSTTSKYETTTEQRVPVMKKKVENLVLKPVFFVMNQKRRSSLMSNSTSSSTTTTSSTNSPAVSGEVSPKMIPTALDLNNQSEEAAGKMDTNQHNKSKPIIRMRRKHHGDQPMTHFRAPSEIWHSQQVPWRPSRPFWSLVGPAHSHNSMNDKLMLVPSGLLTPSGSHLVPLYDPQRLNHMQQASGELSSADEQSKLVNDLFAWRPSRGQQGEPGWQFDNLASQHTVSSSQQQQQQQSQAVKPSSGLAPSGEESFLVAPSAPVISQSDQVDRLVLLASSMEKQHAQQQQNHQQQQQQQIQQASQMSSGQQVNQKESETGLRVPRLLVKPMRPAKYSLNGYIPKPSLTVTGVQAQFAQSQQQTPFQFSSTQGMTSKAGTSSSTKPKLRPSSSSPFAATTSNGAMQQNKDLVSILPLNVVFKSY